MTEYRDNSDPLNDYKDHERHTEYAAIERLLDNVAGSMPLPDGLEDGVFKASVSHLPKTGRLKLTQVQTSVHTPVRKRALQYSMYGRLAMAACIALVFVVGISSVRKPGPLLFSIPISAETPSEWDYGISDAETLINLGDMNYSDVESELNAFELALKDNSNTDDGVN